jgi:hypothetical protein
MQAQMLQLQKNQQIQQKSNQILAAAAANRGGGEVTVTSGSYTALARGKTQSNVN